MRSQLLVSSLSSLLTLLVLSGCNTAYREAMSRAEAAAIQGDFMAAAHAYREACAASPDDEKACSRAPVFALKATDQAIMSARPACDAGDLDRCLPPLLATRDLIPDHPEVTAMLEKASQLQTEHCSQWKAEGPLATAAAGLACLQSRGQQLPVPSYQALLAERAQQLSSRFAQLAATAQGKDSAGAATVLWSAAQCLAPGAEAGSRIDQARQGFLTQSAIPIAARVGGRIPPPIADRLSSLCESMSANLAPAARCVESGTAPGQPKPLEIRVNAFIERAVENVSKNMRSLRYLSGTRQVRNPEYRAARKRLETAEHDFATVESMKNDKDEECKESKRTHAASCVDCPEAEKKKSPCDEARELSEDLEGRTHERNEARRHLDATPETLTEEVYDDFVYSVRSYRWSSSYRFTLESSSPGSVPTAPQEGALRFEDQEHVGFEPGGLRPDPLKVPSSVDYANAFIQQVVPSVFEAVKQDSMARGAARRAQCNELPQSWGLPWVQCWAESSLWESGREPQVTEFLRLLAASAGGPDQPLCR
jgi:hypothetical protein